MTGARLRTYTDGSAYGVQIETFLRMIEDPRTRDRGTDAAVLAEVFVEAATVARPRRRYVRGAMARPALFIRKWLGDGVYEFILRRAFR